MFNRKFTVSSLILAMALSMGACTPKSAPRFHHEQAKDWSVQPEADETTESLRILKNIDGNKYLPYINGNPDEVYLQVLVPLGTVLLNQEVLSSPQARGPELERVLQVFNKALIKTLSDGQGLKEASHRSEIVNLAGLYEHRALANCGQDFRSRCLNLSFFSRDPMTSEVFLKLAVMNDEDISTQVAKVGSLEKCIREDQACQSLLVRRYRLLTLALDTKRNRNRSENLEFAFLRYARSLPELVKKGALPRSMSESFHDVFDTLIGRFDGKNVSPSEVKKFVDSYNPWFYSAKEGDIFRGGAKTLFAVAADCCLYESNSKTGLAAAFRDAIKEIQSSSEQDGPSFHGHVMKLVQRKEFGTANRVLRNMGMESEVAKYLDLRSASYDEFFYIVDRLFNGHLSLLEAQQLLSKTLQARSNQSSRFLRTVREYVRIRILAQVLDTNEFMYGLYQDEGSSDLLFQEILMSSRRLSSQWMKLQAQVDLVDRMMGNYFRQETRSLRDFEETTALLKGLNRNIHYLSVYPNMLGLAFVLNKQKGQITARSWWGSTFTIEAEKVLVDLLDGNLGSPWFKFGSDSVSLTRELMLLTFSYSLQTQAFDLFSKENGVADRAKFIELTLGKYLEADARTLENNIEEMQRKNLSHPLRSQLDQICDYEMGRTQQAPLVSLSLTDLSRFTYAGLGSNSALGVYSSIESDAHVHLRDILGRISNKLAFAKTIYLMLEAHMIESGELQNGVKDSPQLLRMRAIIDKMDQRIRDYTGVIARVRNQYADCGLRLYEIEIQRSLKLYQAETDHLREVHRSLKSMRDLEGKELQSAIAEVNEKLFPQSQYKFDRIEGGSSYRYSRYDLYMRLKRYIEGGVFTQGGQVPFRNVRVYVPEGVTEQAFYIQGEAVNLAYVEDEAEFVKSGLKQLSGERGSYVEWRAQAAQIEFFTRRLDTAIQLQLLGAMTPEELISDYLRQLKAMSMSGEEVKYAQIFDVDGRFSTKSLQSFLVEPDSFRAWPLFRYVMKSTYDMAGVRWGVRDSVVNEAVGVVDTLKNLGVLMYEPAQGLKSNLKTVYGGLVHDRLMRMGRLFEALAKLSPQTRTEFDEVSTMIFRVEKGQPLRLNQTQAGGMAFLDRQQVIDFNDLVRRFGQQTGNFFETDAHVRGVELGQGAR